MVTMDLGLFNLMEGFILKEIDYSQEYGYSSRAKRFMRRKLNQELSTYLEQSNTTNTTNTSERDSDDSDDLDDSEIDINDVEDLDYEPFNLPKTILCKQRPNDSLIHFLYGFTYACIVVTFYGSVMYVVYSYSICNIKVKLD
jgi:hypothetical protein